MPELTQAFLRYKAEYINSENTKKQKQAEYDRWLAFQGNLVPLLEPAIRKEFTRQKTIDEILNRLCPINIITPIIKKLSQVYTEPAIREVGDDNVSDTDLLGMYEDMMLLNIRMQEGNRLFNLDKKLCIEIYIDRDGYPRIRCLPAHTYFAFSESRTSPEIPDNFWKLIQWSEKRQEQIFHVWTDERFLIVDGEGTIKRDLMGQLNNPEGINPYGTLPFCYIVESSISTEPIVEDDLVRTAITIPICLADLYFGVKYQASSLMLVVGAGENKLDVGPNSVVYLERDQAGNAPTIDTVKPEIDIAGTLSLIESTLSYLLSSRGLRTSTLSGKLGVDNAASGISKAIDQATLAEDQRAEQSYFLDIENQLWNKISKYMVPYWIESNEINKSINIPFSETFSIKIQLQNPRVIKTEMEQIEISKKRLEYGFSTINRELANLYPDFDQDELLKLEEDIKQEQLTLMIEEKPIEDVNGE